MSIKPLTLETETQSISATINAVVNGDNEKEDGFDAEPTFEDQWEEMTLDERAKWRDDNGPGI